MTDSLKIKDLEQLLTAGTPVAVEFGPRIEDAESYPEPGMRALAKRYSTNAHDVCRVFFDFSAFDAHNKALEKANYYDKAGAPTLTAREAGQYQPEDDVYFTPDDEMAPWFTLLPNASLALVTQHLKAKEAGSPLSYVAWLEEQVLALQAAAGGLMGQRP